MIIRAEKPSDFDSISNVIHVAFEGNPHSQGREHFIVEALRAAKALTLSLVAEMDGRIVGHVAFSPVAVSDGSHDWYGLGPVAVLPDFQKQGIGTRLVNEGLQQLQSLDAQGCVVLGEPAYYGRFGFKNNPDLILEGVPQEYFMAVSFRDGSTTRATVLYHPSFAV